ncbi:hypothetical protein K2173_006738 [Erythroxylum novogranatense]|uniref:Uncharacterized protein n=1 Tax=Erythroxylum novogranatense TaxID=1862640 RepID=A0AAV8T7L3_9ROSI|nr:hypothetical protein K2173_006738 [Erythroxylum novogranatense]
MAKLLVMYLFLAMTIVGDSTARELRPSYHGLDYQSSPPSGEILSPEMKAFFGTTTSSSSNVPFPRALNSNDTVWWRSVNAGDGKANDARHVLLVASLVCGVTGVVLLVASVSIYLVWHKTPAVPSQSIVIANARK